MAVRVKPVTLTIRNERLFDNILPVFMHCITFEQTVLLRENGVILRENEKLALNALDNPVYLFNLKLSYLYIMFKAPENHL